MSEVKEENKELAHRRKSIELFLDFQWKSIVQTVEVINKAIGFYFLVLLGVFGAIYQAKISGIDLSVAIVAVSLITIAVCAACAFLIWGVITGLYDIQNTLQSFNSGVFDERGLAHYFRRARIVARAVVISSFLVFLVIVGALVSLKYK